MYYKNYITAITGLWLIATLQRWDQIIYYSTGQRQRQNEMRSNAFGGQLKRVCVHHAQIMEGTVERSKHDFY